MWQRIASNLSITRTLLHILIIVVALLAAVLIGSQIGLVGLNYQDIIVLSVILAFLTIALHRRGVEIGFSIWICMFGLGYRVTRVNVPVIVDQILGGRVSPSFFATGSTPVVRIHPLVIIILGVFGLLVLRATATGRKLIEWHLPKLLLVLSIFFVWGWYRASVYERPWNWMFDEVVSILIIFPIFIVTLSLLREPGNWKLVLVTFFVTGTVIAFLGVLEYFFPQIRYAVPGMIADGALVDVAQDGFERALFGFWGQPGAIFISFAGLPLIIPLWNWFNDFPRRFLLVVACCLQLMGIYLAGWRSTWLIGIGAIVLLLLLRKEWIKLLLAAGIVYALIVFNVVPKGMLVRLETIFAAAEGHFEDTSAAKRAGRVEDAFQLALDNPLGVGWAGSGWVHNDFLQIAANLGIAGGVLFALWYVTTLAAIAKQFYQSHDLLTLALVGCFFIVGGLFLTQPMIVVPQYAAPMWFVWAVVEARLKHIHLGGLLNYA